MILLRKTTASAGRRGLRFSFLTAPRVASFGWEGMPSNRARNRKRRCPGSLSLHGCRACVSLLHDQALIGRDVFENVVSPSDPIHLDSVDSFRLAQAKRKACAVVALIAASTMDLAVQRIQARGRALGGWQGIAGVRSRCVIRWMPGRSSRIGRICHDGLTAAMKQRPGDRYRQKKHPDEPSGSWLAVLLRHPLIWAGLNGGHLPKTGL